MHKFNYTASRPHAATRMHDACMQRMRALDGIIIIIIYTLEKNGEIDFSVYLRPSAKYRWPVSLSKCIIVKQNKVESVCRNGMKTVTSLLLLLLLDYY